MKEMDIMRLSASRPEFLKRSTESLLEKIRFDGKLNWILHEDVLNNKASQEVIRWAEESGIFNKIRLEEPPIGQGNSLTWLIDQTRTPYFLNWEDDYVALEVIDLDLVCRVLDECPDVNQIAFHKRGIMSAKGSFQKKQVERAGVSLVTNPHWAFTPAVWRASYIKPRWEVRGDKGFHWEFNRRLKGMEKTGDPLPDADWVIANTGTYYLGEIGGKQMSLHIGAGHSLRVGDYQW